MEKKVFLRLKGRFALGNKKFLSGGFVFAEFAIALPLLILLGFGLATVGAKIFYLGKVQLADYVLEEEVHDVLSRIIYDARAAKIIVAVKDSSTLIFTYRTINEITKNGGTEIGDVIADKEEPRVYILSNEKIYYERQSQITRNPITGNNYFGKTKVIEFKFDKPAEKVLHVTLELESEETHHKIKISTAVYVPGCEKIIS